MNRRVPFARMFAVQASRILRPARADTGIASSSVSSRGRSKPSLITLLSGRRPSASSGMPQFARFPLRLRRPLPTPDHLRLRAHAQHPGQNPDMLGALRDQANALPAPSSHPRRSAGCVVLNHVVQFASDQAVVNRQSFLKRVTRAKRGLFRRQILASRTTGPQCMNQRLQAVPADRVA